MNTYLLELDEHYFTPLDKECLYISTLTQEGPFYRVVVFNMTEDRPLRPWGDAPAFTTTSRERACEVYRQVSRKVTA